MYVLFSSLPCEHAKPCEQVVETCLLLSAGLCWRVDRLKSFVDEHSPALPQDSRGNLAVSWLCNCFLFVPFNKNDADEAAEMGELLYCAQIDVNRTAPAENSCSVCWFGLASVCGK